MLKAKELRKTIGSRAKSRRQELGLNQTYVAEKMGVTASTIQLSLIHIFMLCTYFIDDKI